MTVSNSSLYEKFGRLGREGAIYGLGSMLQRFAALILLPLYTHVLTTADYGILGLVTITGQVAGTVFALGLRSSLFRSFYDYDDAVSRRQVVATVFVLTIVSSVALILVSWLGADAFAEWVLGNRALGVYFKIVITATIGDSISQIALSVFRARRQPGRFAGLQLASFGLRVGLIVYFVVVFEWGVRGVLIGQLAAATVSATVLLVTIRDCIVAGIRWGEVGKLLRYGVPIMFAGVFGFVSTYVDRYLIEYFATLEELGLYSLGYQLGMVVAMVLTTPLKLVWGPVLLSTKDEADLGSFCSKAMTYVVVGGVFLALCLSLMAREIVQVVAAPEYEPAYRLVPIVALAYQVWSIRTMVEVGVVLKRKTGAIAWYTLIGAVVNVAANLVLIPRYGMHGAAWATLGTFSLIVGMDYAYNRRLFRIPYEWSRLARIYLVAGSIFAVGLLIPDGNAFLSVGMKVGLILAFPCVLWAIGFLEATEVAGLRRVAREVMHRVRGRV